MAAMTRLSLTLDPMGISHFHLFFLKPQNRFEQNLAEMFIGWSYTRIVFLVLIGNPTWLPGPMLKLSRVMVAILNFRSANDSQV
jgi:hypothetical protein